MKKEEIMVGDLIHYYSPPSSTSYDCILLVLEKTTPFAEMPGNKRANKRADDISFKVMYIKDSTRFFRERPGAISELWLDCGTVKRLA